MQCLASPERTIDHRQAVKRSGTPAVCRQVTECQRYDRLSDRHICHPLRGSVIDCVISRGSVLCTPPPACVLSCLRHLSFRMPCSTLFFTFHFSLFTFHSSSLHSPLFTLHASRSTFHHPQNFHCSCSCKSSRWLWRIWSRAVPMVERLK